MHLRILVFLSGAAVMILEIVAARFFAPYIGTSVVVWTAVIGTVMSGLAAGYILGGALADRWKSWTQLHMMVYSAALWIGLLAAFRNPFIGTLTRAIHSPAILAVAGTCFLLLPPTVLLGAVTPYAVRLSATDMGSVGRTAGRLSALSTLGSIVGTFLAGFALIPSFGTTAILFACAAVLGCSAMLQRNRRSLAACALFLLALLGLSFAERTLRLRMLERHGYVADVDSPYGVLRVRHVAAAESTTGKEMRYLEIDHGRHAAYMPDDPNAQGFGYTAYYRLADALRNDSVHALMIGGGGYTVTRDFLARHPSGDADVVEIDPEVTVLAQRYFDLPPNDPRIRIHHEDARAYLNRGGPAGAPGSKLGAYQVAFGDAFRNELSVPFHLTTREAAQRIAALLDDNGVYVLNVISSETGANSRFLHAEAATLREVFATVLAFRVPRTDTSAPEAMYNVSLVASKRTVGDAELAAVRDPELRAMLSNRIPLPAGQGNILTDDYAPVEAMLNF